MSSEDNARRNVTFAFTPGMTLLRIKVSGNHSPTKEAAMSGAGPPDPRRPAARRRARRCRAPGPRAREGAAHLSGWATLERRPSRHRLLGRGLERSHGRRHGAEPERLLSIRGHQSVYRPARRIQHAAAEK